jgi:hypothetical protein
MCPTRVPSIKFYCVPSFENAGMFDFIGEGGGGLIEVMLNTIISAAELIHARKRCTAALPL